MAIFAFISCFYYLIVTALIDLFMYLILSLFTRNSIVDIFKKRYYKLFPAAGTKHYQDSYEKWLRKHHEEFENDEPADKRAYEKRKKKNRKIQKFYDDEYDDEIYDDDEFNFFAGCNSLESIDKKYKQLVKLYHPDNPDGDTKALAEINIQYDKAKAKFR
jgi:curved DNA-binding protein CbpA